MQLLLSLYQKLPTWLKNKYTISGIAFFLWLLIFNDYNLLFQWQKSKEIEDLKAKKIYYTKEIERVNQDKQELFSNTESLEKFARENYFMKRDSEDVFIIDFEK